MRHTNLCKGYYELMPSPPHCFAHAASDLLLSSRNVSRRSFAISFAQVIKGVVTSLPLPLVSYVMEGPMWPIKSPKRKKEESERLRGERDQIKLIELRFERGQIVGLSELCWRKAMVAYKKPKKEERGKVKG